MIVEARVTLRLSLRSHPNPRSRIKHHPSHDTDGSSDETGGCRSSQRIRGRDWHFEEFVAIKPGVSIQPFENVDLYSDGRDSKDQPAKTDCSVAPLCSILIDPPASCAVPMEAKREHQAERMANRKESGEE